MGELVVANGLCLLRTKGFVAADLICVGDRIADVRPAGSSKSPCIDARNCLVLPGIVDIHGDAFERQIMPRPKTMFPLDMAMLDTDRQLVANGITTAYHGITFSWEPGLRSLGQSLKIVDLLNDLEASLLADHRLHIRWETFALNERDAVYRLMTQPKSPLLAFNDHASPLATLKDPAAAYRRHAERALLDMNEYVARMEEIMARAAEVHGAVSAMAAAARTHGVRMLSHDDRSPEVRAWYRSLGVKIAEFPVTAEVLDHSAECGDAVVLGAPNVVRGGSHTGAVSAEQAIREGKCRVLASDYYYPAPLHAALKLAERGVLPLERAWELVSSAPAEVAGLTDRGAVAENLRADLVVVCPRARAPIATIAGGRAVYRSR